MKNTLFGLKTVTKVAQAFLSLLIVTLGAYGMCAPDSTGFVFAHPYFGDKAWKNTLSNIDLYVGDSWCDEPILSVGLTNATLQNSAVIYRGNSGLGIATVFSYKDAGTCARYTLDFGDITNLSIPGASVPATGFYLLKQGNSTSDTLSLFYPSVSGTAIIGIHFKASDNSFIRKDSFFVAGLTGSHRFAGVWGDGDGVYGADTGVWVGGSHGLVRHFEVQNRRLINQDTFDLGNTVTDTITCASAQYIGTSQGRIYRRNGANLGSQPQYSGAGNALRFIKSSIAAGDNSTLLIRQGTSWVVKNASAAGLKCLFATVNGDSAGTVAEVCTGYRGIYKSIVFDSASTFASILPASVAAVKNNGILSYDQPSSVSIVLSIRDFDGNTQAPHMKLRENGFGPILSLNNNGQMVLSQREPNVQLVAGKTVWIDTSLTITLTPSAITVQSTTCMRLQLDALCTALKWQSSPYQYTVPWSNSDRLSIVVGSDSLVIVHAQSATSANSPYRMHGSRNSILLGKKNIGLPKGLHLNDIQSIVIADLDGRIYYNGNPAQGRIQTLPLRSRMILVRCRTLDGRTISFSHLFIE